MNKCYSIVWSTVRNMFIVASELARSGSRIRTQVIISDIKALPMRQQKPQSLITLTPGILARALIFALGFSSTLAMAANTVEYIDGTNHDMNADYDNTAPIIYSGTEAGSALYVSGIRGEKELTKTTVTGTGFNLRATGGSAGQPNNMANAINVQFAGSLDLTASTIDVTGPFAAIATVNQYSDLTLRDSAVYVNTDSTFTMMVADTSSTISLINTDVTVTSNTSGDIVAQEGSTLNILDESNIELTNGRLRIVGNNTAYPNGTFLNVSDSTITSTGTNSTITGSREATLTITNATVNHNNEDGAAVEVDNTSTANITGNETKINSGGIGVYGVASTVNIDGATIDAQKDGILMASDGPDKSSFSDDLSTLTVNNALVKSVDGAALHVDKGTVIAPITITDSTFTATNAIELESNATVEASNTRLNGNIAAGETVSTLSLSNGSVLNGSVNAENSTLSLDADSVWAMKGDSTVGSLTNSGEITLSDGDGSSHTLHVSNALTLLDSSQIAVDLKNLATNSIITTDKATLDGELAINSTVDFMSPETDSGFQSITLIDAQEKIVGDFDSVALNIDTTGLPDYITVSAGIDAQDNTNYVLSEGLSWYAGANSAGVAHGTFTLGANDTFEVTSKLSDVTGTANWDGNTLTKEGDGTLVLSNADNDYGATNINVGSLTAKAASALGEGTVTIADAAKLEVGSGELNNLLTGDGSLTKFGSGELTLTNVSNDYGATNVNGGTLKADDAAALGEGNVTLAAKAILKLGSGVLDNVIAGAGSLTKYGDETLTLSGSNSYSGGTLIKSGTLNANNINALGTGDIDNSGTLALNASGNFNLVDAQIVTHDDAALSLAAGTSLNAERLVQEDGSTLNVTLGESVSDPVITADSAALDGTLNITGIGGVTEPWTRESYSYTLIDSGSDIEGDFDEITIAGMDRKATDFITIDGKVNGNEYDLTASLSWYADADNAATNAHGTFTLSDANGSFNVAADLVDVDDSLDPTSTTGWDGKTLTKEGAGGLILSGNNTYSGGTFINDGTLTAASENALGTGLVDNFATLVLDANATVNATGGITTRTDATTVLAAGSALALGDGALVQESGSTLSVDLYNAPDQTLITGDSATLDGALIVSDASLQARASDAQLQSFTLMDMNSDISGDFTSLTMDLTSKPDYLTVNGAIDPDDGSRYLLNETLSWNADVTSATAAHGTFTLEAGKTFEVTSDLNDQAKNADWDGKTLTKLGAGTLILSGNNAYSGDTNIQEGALWLTGSGVIGAEGSQQAVNIASDAILNGGNNATVNGNINNQGTLNFGAGEESDATFFINGSLTNSGVIASGNGTRTPGNTLYIDGDYVGIDGSKIWLNTALGDDSSATDKLIVTGDTSGKTELYIHGIGDQGAQTTTGIEVVDVGGASNGEFTQGNQVQAGLYEYRLYQNADDGDWYLASTSDGDDEGDDGGNDDGNGGDDGGNGGNDDGNGGDVTPQYRADIGAYLGNQWMARNSQIQSLYDREDSQYRSADGNAWARFKAGKSSSQAVNGNVDMDSNYSQLQIGGDILAWSNGQQSFTVGVMGSYINADTDSTGNRGADGSRFSASGNVDGYNLGVYATWFADAQTHSGAYIDSWYQYGLYNNSVENGDVGTEEYDSTANALSLETGYRYDIALDNGNTVSLTPQAQVVWQNYDADSVKDNNGTRIDDQNSDSWTTRLGLRVDGKLYKGDSTVIQPFAEASWVHTSNDIAVSFDGTEVKQDIPANRAELKVGLQADIDKQWSVRAQVAGQTGSNDYGDISGSLNLRYNW